MSTSKVSSTINSSNEEFWDEPCGFNAYTELGFNSSSDFDEWYFNYYPYLFDFIPFDSFQGKNVLEVGLGFGSVSQKIIECGADYHGLDIAQNPVSIVKERLRNLDKKGSVRQGSVLECPWSDSYFDFVVSIGCLHHTGDFIAALKEVNRVLKVGGTAVIMVYNAFSYRQWFTSPFSTIFQFFNDIYKDPTLRQGEEKERLLYDSNKKQEAAPCTQFVGKRGLIKTLKTYFTEVTAVRSENVGDSFFLRWLPRHKKLKYFGPIFGLDLYAVMKK